MFIPLLGDLEHEEFWVLLLNRNNRAIHRFMTSKGGITSTIIDVRMIMKTALERPATSMILCHNHPSGNTMPSDADQQITRKLKEAGKLMDIQVLDHIIIAQKSYYSFADNGLL
jgi:DNA repair protein RadC